MCAHVHVDGDVRLVLLRDHIRQPAAESRSGQPHVFRTGEGAVVRIDMGKLGFNPLFQMFPASTACCTSRTVSGGVLIGPFVAPIGNRDHDQRSDLAHEMDDGKQLRGGAGSGNKCVAARSLGLGFIQLALTRVGLDGHAARFCVFVDIDLDRGQLENTPRGVPDCAFL